MQYYLEAFRKYAVFTGRARRSEYWFFALFHFIVLMVLGGIAGAFSGSQHVGIGYVPYGLYLLFSLIPSIAVGIRRLHDIGKSGWWLLMALVPLVGGIILLIFSCQDSQPGSNQWGPNPKDVAFVPA